MDALLWCGPGAALFGESAGHAWGLVTSEPQSVTVVVPSDRIVRDVPGVVVTRSRHCRARVDPHAWPHRIQARHTVLDLGQGTSVERVIALSAKAIDLGLCSAAALTEALADRPRQAHRAVLTEALADVAAGAESAAEVRYVRDVERAHGLPAGLRQAPFGSSNRLDVAYDAFDLLVEIDGRLGHDDWTGRQRDGRRDRAGAVTGRVTLRCFWTDLVPTACDLALEIATILQRQGWQQMPRPCGRHCPVPDVA